MAEKDVKKAKDEALPPDPKHPDSVNPPPLAEGSIVGTQVVFEGGE